MRGNGVLWVIGAVILFTLWSLGRMQARINATPIGDTQHVPPTQPARASGSQVLFDHGIAFLPPNIPTITRTPDFIPSSGFDAMTRVGNVNQPELLLDPALFDRYRTAPVLQPVVAPQAVPNLPPEAMDVFEEETVLPGQGFYYE